MGTPGQFSTIVLGHLLDAACRVCSVWIPGPPPGAYPLSPPAFSPLPRIPVTQPSALRGLAEEWGIPVHYFEGIDRLDKRVGLAAIQTDLILVACFPYILPRELLALPRFGCLNLHPSLLPAYRGPTPLFWQFRAGESQTGVTLHLMEERIDAGDIIAQESLALPVGISGPEANFQLAHAGGHLMANALDSLEQGMPHRQAQKEGESSYFSWPMDADFRLSTCWSAERAYRFIRGTAEWGRTYEIRIEDANIAVGAAVSYAANAVLERPYELIDDALVIQFSPGVLHASLPNHLPWSCGVGRDCT